MIPGDDPLFRDQIDYAADVERPNLGALALATIARFHSIDSDLEFEERANESREARTVRYRRWSEWARDRTRYRIARDHEADRLAMVRNWRDDYIADAMGARPFRSMMIPMDGTWSGQGDDPWSDFDADD